MKIEEIQRILEVVNSSDISELTLKVGDVELIARKGGSGEHVTSEHVAVDRKIPAARADNGVASVQGDVASAVAVAPSPTATAVAESDDLEQPEGIIIRAPMLGIFYRAPSPGAPPFAEVGQLIHEGDTVGSIEVMKLFSSLASPVTGRVLKFLVNNSELVEHGQPLVIIEPVDE